MLNRLLQHMNIGNGVRFTKEMLDAVQGYDGEYTVDLSERETLAVQRLRKVVSKQLMDLDKLLMATGMDNFFPGLPTEI